jgi:integrase
MMGAKATGNVEWRKGRAYARVTLPEKGPDGKERRRRVALPRGLSPIEAKKQAAEISELVRTGAFVFEGTARSKKPALVKGEPTDKWFDRFCFYREQRGHTTVPDDKSRYKTHIQPVIGAKPFGQTTRRDAEKIRDALDAKVQADTLGWKTAWNVWGLFKRMCRDAHRSKHADLRLVGFEDPAKDVEGPDRGAKKTKAYLFPSEFLALVTCPKVPLVRRRMYAIAVYTYMRAGELEALEWPDVNLEHDIISISRAVERKTGKVGTPKSEEARDIPIDPALKPLLAFLAEQKASARVLRMPPDEDRADLLRADLGRAGIERADLFVGRKHANRKRLTFHDLKATGITWAAVRGDDNVKIHRRAAHRDFKTTLGYIREA